MRVTLVISSLVCGGAQRVLTVMANHWQRGGWSATVLTFDPPGGAPFYPLDSGITLHAFDILGESTGVTQALRSNLRRLSILRHGIRQSSPDVCIAFMDRTNVLTLLASIGLEVPVIVTERIDPGHAATGPCWGTLRRLLYPGASCLVVQSEAARTRLSGIGSTPVVVVPNPVCVPDQQGDRNCSPPSTAARQVVALGRFTPQKGFDLLLRAFSRIASARPQWSLIVWGDGPERASLQTLRDGLGLQGRAHFPGETREPFTELKRADLFVLSSRYEGFPNALCEAMACGLPVISFDCPCGPREIVRHEIDGLLLPPENIDSLSDALARLMDDEKLRRTLAERAPDITSRFGLAEVMGRWTRLVEAAAVRQRLPP